MAPDQTATQRSFRELYREHLTGIVALGVAMTGDRGAAEDIAQEAFARAYRDWDRVSNYEHPGAWVRRVAANLAVSRWRRLRSEAKALTRMAGQRQPEITMPALDEEFWQAVRQLPREQATAIALRYVEDLPVAGIAEVLGCPENTAKSHLRRGRAALAAMLGLEEEDG